MENEVKLEACCRTCLKSSSKLVRLDSDDEADSLKIIFKLASCVSEIFWLEENFPKFICINCLALLRTSYSFRQICISTNDTIKQFLFNRQKLERKRSEVEVKNEEDFPLSNFSISDEEISIVLSPEESGNWDEDEVEEEKYKIPEFGTEKEYSEISQTSDVICSNTIIGEEFSIPEEFEALNKEPISTKSLEKYKGAFETFKTWQKSKNTSSFSEETILAYFDSQSKKYKASTLWSQYSMIRTMMKTHHDIDISRYDKLKRFLRMKAKGYRPNKAAIFPPGTIRRFLNDAPDEKFLDVKVVAVLGTIGATRSEELVRLRVQDIEFHGDVVVVKIPDSKTNKERCFFLKGVYVDILKRYASLRPPKATTDRFFLNYQNGKCTTQVIGRNKISKFPYKIASFLGLPNCDRYTGHSFRRTSAAHSGSARKILSSYSAEDLVEESAEGKRKIDEPIAHNLTGSNIIITTSSSECPETPPTKIMKLHPHYH